MNKTVLTILADTSDYLSENPQVQIIVSAIQWVINALMIIGAGVITYQLVKAGIGRSRADSPEATQKNNTKIKNCIIGLALIVSASIVVNVIAGFIPQWLNQQLGN